MSESTSTENVDDKRQGIEKGERALAYLYNHFKFYIQVRMKKNAMESYEHWQFCRKTPCIIEFQPTQRCIKNWSSEKKTTMRVLLMMKINWNVNPALISIDTRGSTWSWNILLCLPLYLYGFRVTDLGILHRDWINYIHTYICMCSLCTNKTLNNTMYMCICISNRKKCTI